MPALLSLPERETPLSPCVPGERALQSATSKTGLQNTPVAPDKLKRKEPSWLATAIREANTTVRFRSLANREANTTVRFKSLANRTLKIYGT